MKKILFLVFLLASVTSFAQFPNYTNINGRYKWIAGKFDSTFTIPSGTTPSLRVGGGTGPGALFYSTTDSTVYQYTGTRWTRLRGTDTAHVVSAYVRNTTASTMTAGQVVYINGSTGTTPTIALAVNTADSTSAMTFGFVRGTIAPNAFGWITTFGPLEGVNTNAYTEGEVIYLDSIPGQFTHDKPQAPYHMVTLGYIVKKSGGNGTIFAKIQNGYELEELHNVRITSPVKNNAILAYDSVAQLWKDTTLSDIGGVTGSGTSGQVAYWTGTSSQSGSNNLFWDNANGRLGIGTNAPSNTLDVVGNASVSLNISAGSAFLGRILQTSATNDMNITHTGAYAIKFNTNNLERGRFTSGGNFLIGTTSDGGQRLQVNGDVLFKGSGNTGGTTALTVQNSDGTNMLRVRSDNNILIGSASAAISTGNALTTNESNGGILYFSPPSTFDNTGKIGVGIAILSRASTASTAVNSQILQIAEAGAGYAPTSGSLTRTYFQINATINQTGGANGITRGLYVNPTLTAAADWRSLEWSNNTGFGLYGAGTATNYLAGSLGIGSTSLSVTNLRISKNIDGGATAYGILVDGSIRSTVTSEATIFVANPAIQNAAFNVASVRNFYALGVSSAELGSATITNQMGFYAETTLTGATNNFGFYGDIASGTGRWNLYMSGTAANYMNGNLLLGSTTDGGQKLQVTGSSVRFQNAGTFELDLFNSTANTYLRLSATATGGLIGTIQNVPLVFISNASEKMRLTGAGLLGIGTTSPSGRLHIDPADNEIGLNISTSSLTSANAQSLIDLTQTWNTTGSPTLIKANVTNTASGASSLLMDLQVGGVSQFQVTKNGNVGIGTSPSYKLDVAGTFRTQDNTYLVETGTGSVGINTNSVNASAILEIKSTAKGFLPPRMTNAQMVAIATPEAGLVVYDTTNNKLNVYDGTNWVTLH